MKKLLLVAGALIISGCSTVELIRAPGSHVKSEYAPVNDTGPVKIGVVSIVKSSSDSIAESRLKEAYKLMHDSCGGDYKIVDKEFGNTQDLTMKMGTSNYIYFRCI